MKIIKCTFPLILFILIVSASCGNKGTKEPEITLKTDTLSAKKTFKGMDSVRGKRYCELWVVKGGMDDLKVTVYNTLGCNDCPDNLWNQIDRDQLRDVLKAKSVMMNGPRVFMMDRIGHSISTPNRVRFTGLEMIEMASSPVTLKMVMHGKPKPYKENMIHRNAEIIYLKGRKIYQISSPLHTYVMQSYQLRSEPPITVENLENLGAKLTLPQGWKYETIVLKEDLVVKPVDKGKSFILQDDLKNAYLRVK